MDAARARVILESLADGLDPETGEAVAPGSPLDSADVVRALHVALAGIDSLIRRQEKTSLPNAGRAWLPEDDRELAAAFDSGASIDDLARRFGRTEDAIAARLVRIGKVPDRDAARRANRTPPPPATA